MVRFFYLVRGDINEIVGEGGEMKIYRLENVLNDFRINFKTPPLPPPGRSSIIVCLSCDREICTKKRSRKTGKKKKYYRSGF